MGSLVKNRMFQMRDSKWKTQSLLNIFFWSLFYIRMEQNMLTF